jgi:nucleoside-diphosphate-sugar epimerase
MKIVVTGAAGFIGSNLVTALSDSNFEIVAVDRVEPTNSPPSVKKFVGDLRNAEFAESAFKGCDICVALAGVLGGVGYFSRHPASILSDNLLINVNTMRSCVANRLERVVLVSSSCVFSQNVEPPFSENDVIQQEFPIGGYAFSKLAGESLCIAYQEEFGLTYSIVRPFNVYGPGELPGSEIGDGHVIPELIARILERERPLTLLGDGKQTRSFLYIDDLVTALLLVVKNGHLHNMDFNIGSSEEIAISDLANLIWTLDKGNGELEIVSRPAFSGDVARRSADFSRASKLLGWSPSVPLEVGLRRYINWYKGIKK